MTKKELKDIAHAIVWNVFEEKETYQFPKGFFDKLTPDEDKLLVNYINGESDRLQTMLRKQWEAERKQREADRYTNYYNFFPLGEA